MESKDNNKRVKKIVAYILLAIVTTMAILLILWIFDIIKLHKVVFIFGRGLDGGASNSPIFFGLIAIGACYLLAKSEN